MGFSGRVTFLGHLQRARARARAREPPTHTYTLNTYALHTTQHYTLQTLHTYTQLLLLLLLLQSTAPERADSRVSNHCSDWISAI